MQSVGSSSRQSNPQHQGKRGQARSPASLLSYGINFYNDVPNIELDIDTFEIYALKRLKVSLH